jgi:hypothetical protein
MTTVQSTTLAIELPSADPRHEAEIARRVVQPHLVHDELLAL